MNVLLLGKGGREHALAWKMKQSPLLDSLYIAPGNPGTAELGSNINLDSSDFSALKTLLLEKQIDMLVVGPEAPLVEGITNKLKKDADLAHIGVIGPSKEAAMLEGSKAFAKSFMKKYGIPTASYLKVTQSNIDEGMAHIDKTKPPYVLKADGLAAGKGVLIIDDTEAAKEALREMLDGQFGDASRTVVVEQFLDGIELSVFALTDGKSYTILPNAKDYKRIGEGDTGKNTGGMGAISPVPFVNESLMQKIEKRIIAPTVEGIKSENLDYHGFIFFGLMNVKGNPFVVEYNVRMGDPEAEVVLPRLTSDLLELFQRATDNKLELTDCHFDPRVAATIMLVSGGYPGSYEKGKTINGLDKVAGSTVFHAGTKDGTNSLLSNGGRVLALTSLADTMQDALTLSFKNAVKINFEGKYYRKDIGFDLK